MPLQNANLPKGTEEMEEAKRVRDPTSLDRAEVSKKPAFGKLVQGNILTG
jgi:hypothetical protein